MVKYVQIYLTQHNTVSRTFALSHASEENEKTKLFAVEKFPMKTLANLINTHTRHTKREHVH